MPKLQMEQHRLPLNKTLQSQATAQFPPGHDSNDTQRQFVITAAVQSCIQSRSHTPCTTNANIICRQFILNVLLNNLRYMKFSPTTNTFYLNRHIFSSSQLHVSVIYGHQAGTKERKEFHSCI